MTGCSFSGALEVGDTGRWFVYADLRLGRRAVETWLPVHVDTRSHRVSADRRFAYEPRKQGAGAIKYVAGALLYLVMGGLLLAAIRLAAAQPQTTHAAPGVGVRTPP